MGKYAVVKIKGVQYIVEEGKEFLVNKLDKNIDLLVLMAIDDGKLLLGKPYLESVKIKLNIINDIFKGKKVDIFKYKSKSRYRKRLGIRPVFSKLLCEKIDIS